MTSSREDLILRYGGPAPRYTSYPTANHFGPVGPADVRDALGGASRELKVYVHTPFCQKLCWYCGCNTVIRRDTRIGAEHVDRVLAELDLLAPHLPADARMRRLDLGGGTPNFLETDALVRLVRGLEAVLPPAATGPEYASELDPRTVTDAHLDTFLELGFRRFSLGVQTLEPVVQEAVNRPMPRERVGEITHILRRGGARSVNFDLMVGLPHQTRETLDRTLDTVLGVQPDRLAVFQYAHIPSLRPAQKHLERAGLPGPMERDTLMRHAVERLTSAGYCRIGFDHFAVPSDPLAVAAREGRLGRDFQGFTTDAHLDLLALGPSAIGHIDGLFTQNDRDPGRWADSIARATLPVVRGWRLTDEDRRTGRFIHDLMCCGSARWEDGGIAGDAREQAVAALEPMVHDGLVRIDDTGIAVQPAGVDFVRQVAAVFDRYLAQPALHASVA
ncbi:MAG: oxygen-independent coproporphyrinogen III oxidase [Myxococcota bacterium]